MAGRFRGRWLGALTRLLEGLQDTCGSPLSSPCPHARRRPLQASEFTRRTPMITGFDAPSITLIGEDSDRPPPAPRFLAAAALRPVQDPQQQVTDRYQSGSPNGDAHAQDHDQG